MKAHRARFLPLVLAALAGGALPARGASPISSRVLEAESALRAWVEGGGRGDLPLAAPFRASISNLPPEGVPLSLGQEPELRLLVLTDDAAALRNAGFAVGTAAGDVLTVTVPLSRVDDLASVSGVRSVEFPRPLRPLLDVSVPEVNATSVHGGSQPPYTGSAGAGVVVGIVDTGIDYSHPDFHNEDNSPRITRIWDQTDNVGPHPSGYAYGSEWLTATISNGTARERDNDGHGTHVSGIAAGNGRGAPTPAEKYTYVGLAPEAEILFVKTDFSEAGLIDGIAWIQAHAAAKPCVINMSLGSQFGPHDGTSTLDQAMNGLSGPGRVLVAAAGNEGNGGLHAQATLAASVTAQVTFDVGTYSPNGGAGNDVLLIDGWSAFDANFSVSVITPTNITVGPIAVTGLTTQVTADGTVRVEQLLSLDNGDRNLLIDIWDSNGTPPKDGTWKVQLTNNAAGSREMDLWLSLIALGSGVSVSWTNNVDNSELIASPASSDSVIAVGAYVTKVSWDCIASPNPCGYTSPPAIGSAPTFTSPGPLRNGSLKPDLSAPGMGIASTLSADAASSLFTNPFAILTGAYHYVSQGTSQASPHVTGTVALLLQNRPNLAKKDADLALIASVRHDGFTGGGYTNQFGNGKLDAAAALALVTPVRLLSLGASWEGEHAVVRWELAETEQGAIFRVERGPAREGTFTAASGPLEGDLSFSWIDPDPDPGRPWYRILATGRDGSTSPLGTVKLEPLAPKIRLEQNAPNPFAASTVIAFELDRPGDIRLDVVDLSGRAVTVLAAGPYPAGKHEVTWDGMGTGGRPAAAGIYFLRLVTPTGSVLARRMALAQ